MPTYEKLVDSDLEIVEFDSPRVRRRRTVAVYTPEEEDRDSANPTRWLREFSTHIIRRMEEMPVTAQMVAVVGTMILFLMIGSILLIINSIRNRSNTREQDIPTSQERSGNARKSWDSQMGF